MCWVPSSERKNAGQQDKLHVCPLFANQGIFVVVHLARAAAAANVGSAGTSTKAGEVITSSKRAKDSRSWPLSRSKI